MPTLPHPAAIVTILAILFTFYASGRVGHYRHKHKIEAPAMTGHPEFECAVRVHMNTVESLVLFLPLLWMAATWSNGLVAFGLGILWLIGRILYMTGYMADPKKRAPGMMLIMAAMLGLLIQSVIGLAR